MAIAKPAAEASGCRFFIFTVSLPFVLIERALSFTAEIRFMQQFGEVCQCMQMLLKLILRHEE